MDKMTKFVLMVQTDALHECSRGMASVSPGAIVAMAMEIPPHALSNDMNELYEQAQELIQWYAFNAPEPTWVPEDVLYEEVYEEVEVDDDEEYEEGY